MRGFGARPWLAAAFASFAGATASLLFFGVALYLLLIGIGLTLLTVDLASPRRPDA